MKAREDLSEKEIIGVFDLLGLSKNQSGFKNYGHSGIEPEPKVLIARISDSTIPLPTTETTNANMERFGRRN